MPEVLSKRKPELTTAQIELLDHLLSRLRIPHKKLDIKSPDSQRILVLEVRNRSSFETSLTDEEQRHVLDMILTLGIALLEEDRKEISSPIPEVFTDIGKVTINALGEVVGIEEKAA